MVGTVLSPSCFPFIRWVASGRARSPGLSGLHSRALPAGAGVTLGLEGLRVSGRQRAWLVQAHEGGRGGEEVLGTSPG
jgi:hypothetical protein